MKPMNADVLHVFKKGFSFVVDGPGNRLVYHLQGCNFRCPWCANPECFRAPEGQGMPIADMIAEAKQSESLFFAGGGVTFTGGEPTCQFEALRTALQGLKQNGIHTCIESNAAHINLPELYPLIDFLILDCKHYDSTQHRKWTGQGNETVLQNIAAAARSHPHLLVRIPLVSGVNAAVEDAAAFADLFQAMGDFPVELLRYHEFGKPKWEQNGMKYTMRDAQVTPEQAARFKAKLCQKEKRDIC